MNIGILTYHACLNYGACLQAYALQQTIIKYGYNCKIIDYQSHKLISINRPFCKIPMHPKEIIKNITRLPYYSQLKKRESMFLNFINKVQIISSRCTTDEDVQKECNNYDCIVCGSDQTWNQDPSIRYQTPLYYLNFEKKQRRISYATSFGSWEKSFHKQEYKLLPWIKQFDKLSMRERSSVDLLRSKGLNCEWVLDPTLLLNRVDYERIARERLIEEPYILLFSWDGSKEARDIALNLSKSNNRKK